MELYWGIGLCGLTIKEIKEKCNCSIGVYLGCPKNSEKQADEKAIYPICQHQELERVLL